MNGATAALALLTCAARHTSTTAKPAKPKKVTTGTTINPTEAHSASQITHPIRATTPQSSHTDRASKRRWGPGPPFHPAYRSP